MSNFKVGPKITPLGESESLASIERWKQNVTYHLRLDPEFKPYLHSEFGKKSRASPSRSLTNDVKTERVDGNDVTSVVLTKEEKCFIVDMMLDQIANHCPLIPRNDIIRDSSSLKEVWTKIKLYHNLEKSGALMNECWNIKRKPGESPQATFARLKQSYDENLLTSGGLKHVDGPVVEDEEMSPSLLNTMILQWLQILHPQLRDAVTTRFSTQLRDCTYAALFPEISRSVCALLEELNGETISNRVFANKTYQSYQNKNAYKPSFKPNTKKSCEYCKATGKKRFYTHVIEDCLFIKRENSKNYSSAKQVDCVEEESDFLQEQYEEYYSLTGESPVQESKRVEEHVITCAVSTNASPVLTLNKNNKSHEFVVDTGCTGSVIDEKTAEDLDAPIRPTFQRAKMTDGTWMNIIGETEVTLYRDEKPYHLAALVCSDKTDLLLGMPFLKANDVAIRPATNQLIIDGKEFIEYDPVRRQKQNKTNRVTQFTVQSSKRQVILPGESGVFSVHGLGINHKEVAVEPRWNSHCNQKATKESELWPTPQIVSVSNGTIHLPNNSKDPIVVKRTEHIGQIQPKIEVDAEAIQEREFTNLINNVTVPMKKKADFATAVTVNPDKILPPSDEACFKQLLKTYDDVFAPVTGTYNGKFGACFVEVNVGKNIPPQRKGRVPFYSRDNLQTLQSKFDELESMGVFSRPQDVGVTVENINPSFLVNKQHSSDKRLVTDFGSIADYCRQTPSLLPNVDSTLRNIGTWKYLIKMDMSKSYFQLLLAKSSKKYCGVHTPFKGLRVYNVGCMGLPGVEVALEELTCLLLGDLVMENRVEKLADDLFIGGETPKDLLLNFEIVLHRLLEANIKLSPAKTVIAPKSISVLGWIWTSGQMSASPHRLTALATCPRPDSVKGLKTYVATYRFISRVIPGYAKCLAPLEAVTRGKDVKDKIVWSSDLQDAFHKAQKAVLDAKTITIPIPSDKLWIVTDAALRPFAIGATLYAVRNGKALLSGFYNAKLPEFQTRWLPCEVEGLAIAAALSHYSPFIIQSKEKPQIMTDSKACVQAAQKLGRGEFSTSARLTTFLSSVSRYGAQIQHIPGSMNLSSDYASRHPLVCTTPDICQVCKFVREIPESVVNEVSISDIVDGKTNLPYTNRASWKEVQAECPNLRKVFSHKSNGTVPSKKSKNQRSVRKYLSSNVLISSDGLLVHRLVKPLSSYDQIVVPEQVLEGLLTALHIKLQHPSASQLSKMFSRYFFCLNTDKAVSAISKSCYHCASIKEVPKSLIKQSTSDPPSGVGYNYAADIVKRCKQKVFVIRETTTSYTLAELIEDETAKEVTSILLKLCNILKPSKLCPVKVRLDPSPAHKSMMLKLPTDSELSRNNISLELGRSVNPNKNPVIDKCIRELHKEILNTKPDGGPITSLQLSQAVASLNGRIRSSGLSAYELWTQRDQVTGEQLPLDDRELILQQHQRRKQNHPSSEKSKAGNKRSLAAPDVKIGTLVYIYTDRDKTEARQRYIVTRISESGYKLRKFTAKYFSSKEYDVKPSEVYVVPDYYKESPPVDYDSSSSEDEFYAATELPNQRRPPGVTSGHRSRQDSVTSEATKPDSGESSDHEEEESLSESDEEIETSVNPTLPSNTVPPRELMDPANRRSIGIRGRLRKRKPINYNENN